MGTGDRRQPSAADDPTPGNRGFASGKYSAFRALVTEALARLAAPDRCEGLIERALVLHGADIVPSDAPQALLFLTGALHPVVAEELGPAAAQSLIQDVRPLLEKALGQLVLETEAEPGAAASAPATIPPPPRVGFSESRPTEPAPASLVPSSSVLPAGEATDEASCHPSPTMRRATMPYMAAVDDGAFVEDAPRAGATLTSDNDVLLVDDDVMFRRSLSRVLRARGYEVIAVADGPSALRMCQHFRPSLIVTDWHMPPGMSGFELAAALHERFGKSMAPLVVISGAPNVPEGGRGVATVLRKGTDVGNLLERLVEVVGSHAAQASQG
ncbi:MAG: response regulator [Myxococcota bacterium]